jgi:RES domain
MAPGPPPDGYRGSPCRRVLPAGTQLHRVHEWRNPALDFAPVVADEHFGGGRFDPTADDKFPYLYAAFSPATALAEVVLRNIPFNSRGSRFLPKAAVRGRGVSSLALAADLTLVALTTGVELAAIGQDAWLVQAEETDYGKTRRWGHWLRSQATWAQGFIWPSRRNMGEEAIILFGDRCGPDTLRPGTSSPVDLDSRDGAAWLMAVLAEHRVTLRLPPA